MSEQARYQRVIPYLGYADAPAALEFLCNAFGFEETMRMPMDDGRIGHAELALDADFRFLGLRTHTKVPIGAYFGTDRNLRSATGGLGGLAGVYAP